MDKRKQYNDLYNEGGEGHNPYADKEEGQPTTEQRKQARMSRLLAIMAGTSSQDSRMTELQDEYNTLFEQAYPREWTIQARETWNNEMKAKKAAGQKVDPWETEKRLGISRVALKAAIKHYKL